MMSSMSTSGFGFFVCFVGLVGVGYYAHTQHTKLTEAQDQASAQAGEITSLNARLQQAEGTVKTSAAAEQTCQAQSQDLKSKLDAALASKGKGGTRGSRHK
jgi:hypothetical protein